jgi:hypothetical protein
MSRPERGQYGNTRGVERQRRKRENRARQHRNQLAAEETAKHQQELDALIARQQREPAWGAAEGARIQKELEQKHATRLAEIEVQEPPEDVVTDTADEATEIVKKFSISSLPKDSKDDIEQFAVTTARLMIKAGYHAEHVINLTGVGWDELSDLPLDSDGYGCWNRLVERDDDC